MGFAGSQVSISQVAGFLEILDQAIAHLRCRLAGEGNGQNFFGAFTTGQQFQYALGQQFRLTRPGRCLDTAGQAGIQGHLPFPGILGDRGRHWPIPSSMRHTGRMKQ